jgi:hypothetical protein
MLKFCVLTFLCFSIPVIASGSLIAFDDFDIETDDYTAEIPRGH